MRNTLKLVLLVSTQSIAMDALAENYDYQVDVGYQSTQFDGSQTITTVGGTVFNSIDTDTDVLSISGSWYFSGLSDDKGPRARASLVGRASSLSFGYSSTDQTNTTFLDSDDPAFPFPPIDSRLETDGDAFAIDLRYVDRDSGWFGNVGLLTTDVTVGGFVDDSIDANGWSLGVGKYLFDTTTLGVNVSIVDGGGGLDASIVTVAFEHLADLGDSWQYAVDLSYEQLDPDAGSDIDTWGAALSLYPSTDFEFGIRVEDTDGVFGQGGTSVEGFASWFVKPNVRLAAGYRVDDVDFFGNVAIGGAPTVSDADQDAFGISASIRF